MRAYAVFVFCTVAFTVPMSAYAAFTPLPIPNTVSCTAQNAGSPSGTKVFTASEVNQLKEHIQKIVQCPSACFDVRVAVSVDVGIITETKVTVKASGTNKCLKTGADPNAEDAKAAKRGCGKDETQPTVTVDVPAITGVLEKKTIGPKSRCDAQVTDVTDQMFSRIQSGDTDGFRSDIAALDALPRTVAPLSVGSVNGNESLVNAFKAAGVSEADARAAIDRDPVAAANLINAINTGDNAAFEKNKTALGLNANLSDIDRLAVRQAGEEALSARAKNDAAPGNDVTGFDTGNTRTGLPTQCGVEGIAGNIMLAESGCGRVNYNPLSSVQGPYHFLCGTWQQYVAATGVGNPDCANRNDVQMSTQVMNAMMDVHWQKYGSACTSAGISESSCKYAIHVWGEGGFSRIMQVMQANPNAPAATLCGTALSDGACKNNWSILSQSGTVAGMFRNFDSRLTGSRIISGVAQYPASPFSVLGAESYYGSGYGVAYGSSPFATVSPVPIGYAAPAPLPSSYTQPTSQQPAQQPATQRPQTATNPTSTPVTTPAVATIIAQPRSVMKGDSISVSWSTVGMSVQRPCQVFAGTTFLAQGNEGTRKFSTQSTSPESVVFKLKCTALSGQTVEQETSVQIK